MGMTEQEAIKILQPMIRTDSFDETFAEIQRDCALTMGIKALEKQIAKKPVKRSFIVPYEGINVCPSCKKPLVNKEHHCKCGQKLDWENEDKKGNLM